MPPKENAPVARKPVDRRADKGIHHVRVVTGLGYVRKARTVICTLTGGLLQPSASDESGLIGVHA